jgi:hypothetical protein
MRAGPTNQWSPPEPAGSVSVHSQLSGGWPRRLTGGVSAQIACDDIQAVLSNHHMKQKARAYRLSFIINTAIGGTLILIAILAYMERLAYPVIAHNKIQWGFELVGISCLAVAYICRRMYLRLSR